MELLLSSPVRLIALMGICISGIAFLVHAKRYRILKPSLDGFLISDKSLSGQAFANTYAASSLSLAMCIIYFLENHQIYGWLMGIGPLFLIFVQFYLLHTVKEIKLDLTKIRTVSDLWLSIFPSKLISRSISLLTVLTVLMTIFIEIYIGSEVLSIFFQDSPFYRAGSFFVLGILVLAYVYFGGYRTIIHTDKWQLFMLIISSIAIVYFAVGATIVDEAFTSGVALERLLAYQDSGWSLYTFLCWACIINICFCFTDIAMWQRMAASSSVDESFKGLRSGLWKTLLIFWLPMMSIILLYAKGYEYNTMRGFLEIVLNQSGAVAYIVFPLIVTGFTAALFSTADTYMIAAIYGLCDQSTFLPAFHRLSKNQQEKVVRQYILMATLGIFLFLSVFYYINCYEIKNWIMPVLYAVWGQSAIIAPLAMYAIYIHRHNLGQITVTKSRNVTLFVFLLVGWSILLVGSIVDALLDTQIYSQCAFLLSLLIVAIGLMVIHHNAHSKQQKWIVKYS